MTPNGCHSKPRPTPQTRIIVRDGWTAAIPETAMGRDELAAAVRFVPVRHVMSCACVYGPTNNDPRCGAFPDLGLAPCPHLTGDPKP